MRVFLAILLACACAACSGKTNPPGGSGSGQVPQISGTERLGWSQATNPSDDVASYQFFLYVDGGSRSSLGNVSCAASSSSPAFDCSGSLPGLAAGSHTLELTASGSDGTESPRSAPLQVLVVRTVASAATSVKSGANAANSDAASGGVQLNLHEVATGSIDPTDLAALPDGRIFVAERAGRVRILDDSGQWSAPALNLEEMNEQAGGGLLAIAVDPDFARSRLLYTVYTTAEGFRLARFHEVDDAFVERVVVLDEITASATPAAAVRFGPDALLYVGFDDGDVPSRAGDFGFYNGKVLRLNPDGTVPSDQAGLNPVWASNLLAPRGLDWALPSGTLWAIEGSGRRPDRLDAIATDASRIKRGRIVSQYALPDRADPSGIVAYRSDLISQWRGDLLVSLANTQELLRLRLNSSSATQVAQTERVLQGEAGAIRAMAVSPAGSIYLLNDRSLLELAPQP